MVSVLKRSGDSMEARAPIIELTEWPTKLTSFKLNSSMMSSMSKA
jgi:hypothetical protein